MLGVALWPEEWKKRIPPMKSVRRRDGKIGEQRQAFRLRDDRAELGALGVREVESAERLQPDHRAKVGRGTGRGNAAFTSAIVDRYG